MIDIKFRGKEEDNGVWVYGHYACRDDVKEHYIIEDLSHVDGWEWNATASYVHPNTVTQFTGLRDKNSVEVYFNDIINFYDSLAGVYKIGRVVHFSDTLSVGVVLDNRNVQLYPSHRMNYEVIGNIYDDQHLLKGDN